MLLWLSTNIGTIIVSVIIAVVVITIAIRLIVNKRQGKSSCGNGCSGCAMSSSCHPKK